MQQTTDVWSPQDVFAIWCSSIPCLLVQVRWKPLLLTNQTWATEMYLKLGYQQIFDGYSSVSPFRLPFWEIPHANFPNFSQVMAKCLDHSVGRTRSVARWWTSWFQGHGTPSVTLRWFGGARCGAVKPWWLRFGQKQRSLLVIHKPSNKPKMICGSFWDSVRPLGDLSAWSHGHFLAKWGNWSRKSTWLGSLTTRIWFSTCLVPWCRPEASTHTEIWQTRNKTPPFFSVILQLSKRRKHNFSLFW